MRTQVSQSFLLAITLAGLAACSSSDHPGSQQNPPAEIGVDGVVSDGPVAGGTIYALTSAQMLGVLRAVGMGEAFAAALAASGAVSFDRDPVEEDQFDIRVPGNLAGNIVFLALDGTDAEDLEFGDTPPHLYSIAVLGTGGSRQRVNISLHTSVIVRQILSQLDPAGSPPTDGQLRALLQAAELATLDALGEDSVGRDLFEGGGSPLGDDDDEAVHRASGTLGLLIRELAAAAGSSPDEILAALAADAADGEIDGLIPALLNPSETLQALAELLREHRSRENDADWRMFAVGPCSSSAVALRRACAADVIDDGYEQRALCADIADDADRAACIAEAEAADEESTEECAAVFEARLAVCDALVDAPHDPSFGMPFATSFVDPTTIGDTVEPNPYFPLVPGNRWIYESEDETIVVEVLGETKLIDGITCVTVNDVVTEDGIVIEDTDDWYAQDVDGNVWYCGEIAQNFELFDGDEPELPELVDIEGSWKHGREGAEAGLLLPFEPTVGTTIRQEVLYGEAEDVIEILSATATETSPAASCTDSCLQTRDFTPLEPDVEEHKFYVPGVGLIVELDPATGERLELVEFTPGG